MADCRYYYDEFCVNDKCPMCADYCPVPDTPDVPEGGGTGDSDIKNYILFGKTDGIGWYSVSKDGANLNDNLSAFFNSSRDVST